MDNYVPFPKNPKIAHIFKEIGYAEELGTGIKNIDKYTKIYSEGIPTFKEDETFKVEVPLTKNSELNDSELLNENKEIILKIIKEKPKITQEELSNETGMSIRTIKRMITDLKESKYIERIGSKKVGNWKINKNI